MDAKWPTIVALLIASSVAAKEVSPDCVNAVQRCFDTRGQGNQVTAPNQINQASATNQAHDSMSQNICQPMFTWMTCLSGLGDQCEVDETQTTFQELVPVIRDGCNALAPLLGGLGQCQFLAECVSQTEFSRLFNLSDPNVDRERQMQIVARHVITTGFWCRFASDNLGCFLSTADTCAFASNVTESVRPFLDSVKTTCKMSGGGWSIHQGTLLVAVVLWTAVWLL